MRRRLTVSKKVTQNSVNIARLKSLLHPKDEYGFFYLLLYNLERGSRKIKHTPYYLMSIIF